MKKTKLLLPLVMAIVMMAMCPMKMWADSPQVSLNKSKLQNALTAISTDFTLTFADAAPAGAEADPVVLDNVNSLYLYKVGTAYTVAPTVSGAEIMAPTDCQYMFQNLTTLTSLDLTNFNTANVTDMRGMFKKCSKLETLTFGSNFTTANVTDMYEMFNKCSSLTSLDLSNFNTANVKYMNYMFAECSNLQTLTLGSNFNTAKVTTMLEMFYNCSKLTSLDLSNFNTANVTIMSSMFEGCSSLTSLTIGNFDMQKVGLCDYMFDYVNTSLATLNLKAVPYLKRYTFNSVSWGSVNYQLDDNSVIYTGATNYLPAATAAPTYTREMANEWGTVVVPFSITYDANNGNYKLYKLTEAKVPVNEGDEEGTLTFAEYDDNATIPAGTPMTIKATSTKNDGKYTVTLTAGSNAVSTSINSYKVTKGNVIMNGTYAKTTIGGEAGTWEYFIAQNKFWWAEAEATVAPFRGWFELDYGYDEGEGDLAKVFNIVIDENGETTAIGEISNGTLTTFSSAKPNNAVYNLNGQRLAEPQKGQINIINGRKVFVK